MIRKLMVCATCKQYVSHSLSADGKHYICRNCGGKTKAEAK